MKNKFWNLYKTTLFNSYNKKRTDKKTAALSGIITSAVVYFCSFIFALLYSFIGFEILKQNNLENYFPVIVYCITVLMTFMLTINKSKSTIFDNRYNDLLFAMPIKSKTILSVRIVTLLTMNYITTFVVLVPSLIVFGVLSKFGILYYLFAFLVMVFTPFLPVAFAAFIGYFIAFLSSKAKRAEKIVEVLVTFLFFITFFVCYSFAGKIFTIALSNIDKIDMFINKYGFILKYVIDALIDLNFVALTKFVVINLVLLLILIWGLSFGFFKISSNLSEKTTKRKSNKNITYSKNNILKTLTIKELKNLFSIPTYIFNSLLGVVILMIMAISTFFLSKEKVFGIMNIETMENMELYTATLVLAAISFIVSMSNTTCSSISLEGNKFWIIKSLPINPKKVLNSKILTNVITVSTPCIFSLLLICFNFKISIVETLLILTILVVINIVCAQFGLLVNLTFPKLKFESEIQAIKQSTSSFVTVFSMMFFAIVIIVLSFVLTFALGSVVTFILILTFSVTIALCEKLLLNTYGVKKLINLSN